MAGLSINFSEVRLPGLSLLCELWVLTMMTADPNVPEFDTDDSN